MGKLLEVKEYDSITCNENYKYDEQFKYLDEQSFADLENLILTFEVGLEADAMDFFSITTRRNVGKVIRVKNYVGLVQLKNGTQVQILPKIEAGAGVDTKHTFLRMLRSMKDFPGKVFSDSNLKLDRMNLYEVFINMYIQEVRSLVKKGIRSAYHPVEENMHFYKGKLLVNEHIKRNSVHKERFFVSYDTFGVNRAENRLIKSTLLKLVKLSDSAENIKKLRQLLSGFEMVETSKNYEKDFAHVLIDRSTKDYESLIRWSKVFLMNKSFTTFAGDISARALLFPMEKVFEAYVGRNIKKALIDSNYSASLQDKGYYLFERQFALRPDIVIEKDDHSRKIILDTKWKALVNNERRNYGISQADMYQMYAYAKKYETNEIWLLYPTNEEMQNADRIEFNSGDGVEVKVFFVDVSNIEASLEELLGLINL